MNPVLGSQKKGWLGLRNCLQNPHWGIFVYQIKSADVILLIISLVNISVRAAMYLHFILLSKGDLASEPTLWAIKYNLNLWPLLLTIFFVEHNIVVGPEWVLSMFMFYHCHYYCYLYCRCSKQVLTDYLTRWRMNEWMNELFQTLTFPSSMVFSQVRIIVPSDSFVWKIMWDQTWRHVLHQLECNCACKDQNMLASSSHKLHVVKMLFLCLCDWIHQCFKHIFGRDRKGNSKGHPNSELLKHEKKTMLVQHKQVWHFYLWIIKLKF